MAVRVNCLPIYTRPGTLPFDQMKRFCFYPLFNREDFGPARGKCALACDFTLARLFCAWANEIHLRWTLCESFISQFDQMKRFCFYPLFNREDFGPAKGGGALACDFTLARLFCARASEILPRWTLSESFISQFDQMKRFCFYPLFKREFLALRRVEAR
jgi:hypothetical protein